MMNRLAWLGLGILLVTTPSWANWEVAADSRVQFVSIKQINPLLQKFEHHSMTGKLRFPFLT